MYTKNDRIYSDAGKYLASGLTVGYELPADLENIEEKDVDLSDMELRTTKSGIVNAHCTNGLLSFGVKGDGSEEPDYAKLKTEVVKIRYSNDDQIAIMLNKDKDEAHALDYTRMQAWRDWAGEVATKIMSLLENE